MVVASCRQRQPTEFQHGTVERAKEIQGIDGFGQGHRAAALVAGLQQAPRCFRAIAFMMSRSSTCGNRTCTPLMSCTVARDTASDSNGNPLRMMSMSMPDSV